MKAALHASLAIVLAAASCPGLSRSAAAQNVQRCSVNPVKVPARPVRLDGTVVGVISPERVKVITKRVEKETGARISPDYADLPRIVAKVVTGQRTFAELAGAHGFIATLPQGYDTEIEERGANLSGGQRQRIAIARALATDPRILIFDEATSALDYESERIIQDNMRQIVQGRTVVIIAHRLAAVRGCHRIIALDRGRIVEEGTHAELLRREGGVYARLWALQSDNVSA